MVDYSASRWDSSVSATRDELMAHIADQKRRYQTVSLSHEQADALVRLTASAPGEQQPVAYVSRLDLAKVRASGCVNTILTRDQQRHAEGIVPVYTSAPPAAGWDAETVHQTIYKHVHKALEGLVPDVFPEKEMWKASQDAAIALRREAPASSGKADECAATGRSCEYEPSGPRGEHQCQYCGKPSRSDAGGDVRVKPLEWQECWAGSDEDIPCWRGKNPLGLFADVSFAGTYNLVRHSDAPAGELAARKVEAQARYEHRILSALSTPPAAVKSNGSAEARLRKLGDVEAVKAVLIYPDDGSTAVPLEYVLIRGFSEMGWAQPSSAAHEICEQVAALPPAVGGEAKKSEGGCICQEQHRRGYCTEPGCPYTARPSSPTADVTWGELHAFILANSESWEDEGAATSALLDAFTVGRR